MVCIIKTTYTTKLVGKCRHSFLCKIFQNISEQFKLKMLYNMLKCYILPVIHNCFFSQQTQYQVAPPIGVLLKVVPNIPSVQSFVAHTSPPTQKTLSYQDKNSSTEWLPWLQRLNLSNNYKQPFCCIVFILYSMVCVVEQ